MHLPEEYEFFCPVKTNSGNRALEHLPYELNALNAVKPLVLITQEDAAKGLVDIIIDAFKDSGLTIGIFDSVPSSPDLHLIRELFHIYRDGGYDSLIAVGGGAVIDTAKVLNIAVSGKPEDIERYGGKDVLEKPLNPFILLPTLSGTGYESTGYAYLGVLSFFSPFLMPHLVVIDPRVVLTEDVKRIAAASLIALTHAVEIYAGTEKNPLSEAYAYTAIQFVVENLVRVIKNPGNGKARIALANANHAAGCAFSNSIPGMTHRLGKVVGDVCHSSHGLCMGVLLPHVLERQMSREEYHFSDLLLPLAGFDVYAETAENYRAQKAITFLYEFQKTLFEASGGAIVSTLKDIGVPAEKVQEIVRRVTDYGSWEGDENEWEIILEQAWKGK